MPDETISDPEKNAELVLPDRVVFVCHKLDGGIGRNILRLSRDFTSRGIQLQIWSADRESSFPGELPEGVTFKHLTTTHAISGVPIVMRLIKAFQPQIIVTPSERFTRLVYRARKLSFKCFPMIVACVHNIYSLFYGNLPASKQNKRRKLIGKIYPKVEAVICVSQAVMNDYLQYTRSSANNVVTIYNPIVDETVVRNDSTSLPATIDQNAPIIVNVGNIVEQKNHEFLIESFLRLRQRQKCSLIIVGHGNTSKLEEIIGQSNFRDSIHFVGHQSDPYTFIAVADLFAFTSRYEGFGNVVVESLLFGTPVLSTDSGGPKEILCDEDFGEVVQTADPDEFASRMSVWLQKTVDREKLSNYAKNHYSVSAISDQYLNLFSRLLLASRK